MVPAFPDVMDEYRMKSRSTNSTGSAKRRLLGLGWVLGCFIGLALAGCDAESQADSAADDAKPGSTSSATYEADFPAGHDYPATQDLEKALEQKNRERLAEHARALWNGINKLRDGQPWWRAWETAGTLYEPKCESLKQKRGRLAGERVRGPAYHLTRVVKDKHPDFDFGEVCDGPTHQDNGDILIVDISYNPAAAAWIRERGLNDSRVLDKLRGAGKPSIEPFPAESIVTKHMYWPVKNSRVATALPVWKRPAKPDQPIVYMGYETWDDVVAVRPLPPTEDFAPVSYLFGVTDIPNRKDGKTSGPIKKIAPTVPIDALVHHQVAPEEYDALDIRDRVLLDLSASWAYGGTFEPGDYLVSVAMHINTREIPGWTLQSIWWEPPSGAEGEAYPLVVSDGLREDDGKVRDAFNPFIELAARHPVLTDCRNCHIRAGWPTRGGTPSAGYEYPERYKRLDWIPPDAPEFKGLTMLDFQWSTADRASKNPPAAP